MTRSTEKPRLDREREQREIRERGLDTVAGAFAYPGGEDLVKPGLGNRRRTRIEIDTPDGPTQWYLKRYGALPLSRRIRLALGKGRFCEAEREFANVQAATNAGVPTMQALACGADRDLLGVKRSYILVSAVPGDALERVGESFVESHSEAEVEKLVEALAALTKKFHAAGFVHRDYYGAHIFLHEHEHEHEQADGGGFTLNLIDLARALQPCCRRFRWRVKDLAQLRYSMPWLWDREGAWSQFLSLYLDAPGEADRWARAIDAKVATMRSRDARRASRRGGAK